MSRLALMSVLVVFAAPTAALAQADSQVNPKAAYYELCASCHKQPQRLAARMAKTDEARAKLDAFLVKHYAPDADKRAAVIDFLYAAK